MGIGPRDETKNYYCLIFHRGFGQLVVDGHQPSPRNMTDQVTFLDTMKALIEFPNLKAELHAQPY